MLIPENVTFLTTSLLNYEIYNKINDSATSRDKGAQRKRRQGAQSTIPFVKSVVVMKKLEHNTQHEIPRDISTKLQDVSALRHKSLRLNNTILQKYKEKEKANHI